MQSETIYNIYKHVMYYDNIVTDPYRFDRLGALKSNTDDLPPEI